MLLFSELKLVAKETKIVRTPLYLVRRQVFLFSVKNIIAFQLVFAPCQHYNLESPTPQAVLNLVAFLFPAK